MKPVKLMAVAAVLVPLAGLALLGQAAKAADPAAKIAWRLMADTEGGRTAEALVVLREQADLSSAASLSTKAAKGQFVVDALRAVADRTQVGLRAELNQRGVPYQSFYIVNMIKVRGDRALMVDLAARADVVSIDANPRVRASLPVAARIAARPAGPDTIEWNVSRVKAPDVWALGFRGEGGVVADADVGVKWDHPALKNHYRGWNGVSADHNFNWHDAITNSPAPIDPHGHGTHTTGTMVGDDGGANQIGVAPGAKWIACRNMDSGGNGTPATYTECFEWLIAPYPIGGDPSQGDPSKAPDSINNSWGCPPQEGCNKGTLQSIVRAVRAAGIFPAVAAGNAGPSCATVADPPSFYIESFSVGATTMSDAIAGFSSRGPSAYGAAAWVKPNISAPGSGVRSSVPPAGYTNMSGTSMATPHVAGAVALLWQAKPSLSGNIDATEDALESAAVPKTSGETCGGRPGSMVPNNTFGWGILDVLAAVEAP